MKVLVGVVNAIVVVVVSWNRNDVRPSFLVNLIAAVLIGFVMMVDN